MIANTILNSKSFSRAFEDNACLNIALKNFANIKFCKLGLNDRPPLFDVAIFPDGSGIMYVTVDGRPDISKSIVVLDNCHSIGSLQMLSEVPELLRLHDQLNSSARV